jgi:hypothetical protein
VLQFIIYTQRRKRCKERFRAVRGIFSELRQSRNVRPEISRVKNSSMTKQNIIQSSSRSINSSTSTLEPSASLPSRIIACSWSFNRWMLASSSRSRRRNLAAYRCASIATGLSFDEDCGGISLVGLDALGGIIVDGRAGFNPVRNPVRGTIEDRLRGDIKIPLRRGTLRAPCDGLPPREDGDGASGTRTQFVFRSRSVFRSSRRELWVASPSSSGNCPGIGVESRRDPNTSSR